MELIDVVFREFQESPLLKEYSWSKIGTNPRSDGSCQDSDREAKLRETTRLRGAEGG